MMRKYIVGAIFGAALMFAASAYAEDVKSLIGRSIQGEFPVKIDGKELEKRAIVVDGSSYLPVRAFGEATGFDVKFNPEGEVLLTKIVEQPSGSETPSNEKPQTEQPKPPYDGPSIEELNSRLTEYEQEVSYRKSELEKLKEYEKTQDVTAQKEFNESRIELLTEAIANLKAQIAELESR